MSAVTPTQFDTFHMWPCVSLFARLLAPEDSGYLLFYFQPAPESVRHKLSDSAKWNVDNLILDTWADCDKGSYVGPDQEWEW